MLSFKKKTDIKNHIVKKVMTFSKDYIPVDVQRESTQSPMIRKMDVNERSAVRTNPTKGTTSTIQTYPMKGTMSVT